MALHKSAEDYLEAILVLKNQKGVVHSIDVAHHMGYSKPSISRAVGNLRADGMLTMAPNGELNLTEAGQTVAENIYERHTVLTRLFTSLGVSDQTAADDACRVEHAISQETFDRIREMTRRLEAAHPGGMPDLFDDTAKDKDKDDKKKKRKKKK